jgi:tRNA (adenine58-N1)-methyltransferase non-catalytic subunit
MDLSVESIGLILSLASVCAEGRYLIIDETGLLIASVLEAGASVFLLHENQEPNLDALKFFPHLQHHVRIDPPSPESADSTTTPKDVTFQSMDFLAAFRPEVITLRQPIQKDREDNLYERKLRTYNRELLTHKQWSHGSFDGFISISSYDPGTYLPYILPKLALSSQLVIYSPFREVIVDLQNALTTKMPTRPVLAPTVHEVRAPRWSTLKGRVRPDMVGRGGGGTILCGTRVEEGEVEEVREKSVKKRKVQKQLNGTAMEDVEKDVETA